MSQAPTNSWQVSPERHVAAGYTAKDEEAVAEHIAELARIGVPPPASVPAFYRLDPVLLTTEAVVEVAGRRPRARWW